MWTTGSGLVGYFVTAAGTRHEIDDSNFWTQRDGALVMMRRRRPESGQMRTSRSGQPVASRAVGNERPDPADRAKSLRVNVLEGGLEPPQDCSHQILSLVFNLSLSDLLCREVSRLRECKTL